MEVLYEKNIWDISLDRKLEMSPKSLCIGTYIKIVWQSCPQQSKACIQNILHIHKRIDQAFYFGEWREKKKNSNGAESCIFVY